MSNLKLWELVDKTNPNDTKKAKLKGGFQATAICAQSQVKKATEMFGIFGTNWGVKNQTFNILKLSDDFHDSIMVYTAVLYYHFEGKDGVLDIDSEVDIWNYSRNFKSWAKNNDIHKKAKTDALTKGLSILGFNADVFMGLFDDNKYIQKMNQQFAEFKQIEDQKAKQQLLLNQPEVQPIKTALLTSGLESSKKVNVFDKTNKTVILNEMRRLMKAIGLTTATQAISYINSSIVSAIPVSSSSELTAHQITEVIDCLHIDLDGGDFK